jgi:acyl-coenzyme A thioesterase PaaI-like protein
MTSASQRTPVPPRPHGATDVLSPADALDVHGPRRLALGRMERLMRVRLVDNPDDGVFGERTGTMATGPWVLDPEGRPTGAAAAVIMDNTLATAVHAAERELTWIVTTELELQVLRPLPTDGTVLEAWTRPRATDPQGGVATGALRGPDGTEYVRATGWFQGVEGNTSAAVEHFRDMAALPLGADTEIPLATLLRAEGVTAVGSGRRPEPTEGFRPGLRFARNDELHNVRGAVHGGALTMMASLAAQQAMPDRAGYDLQSLRTLFLRPAGGAVSSRVRVRHAGRSLRVVDVELFSGEADATGKAFIQAQAVFRTAR